MGLKSSENLLPFLWQVLLSGLLGMALGLERQRAGQTETGRGPFAGIRTFSLVGAMGCLAATVAAATNVAVLVVSLACVGTLAAISYVADVKEDKGVTTEVTFLFAFLIGALVQQGGYLEAAAVTLGAMALLAYRESLHALVTKVSPEDISNSIKFGLVSLVILPILPNRAFGPGGLLNPYVVWWMVVLMSGISFAGYLLVKIVGPRAGIGLTGLLGGLASSTAVTLTFSQRSRGAAPSLLKPYAMAVVIACTILYPRLFVEALAVNPALAAELAPLLGASLLLGLVLAGLLARTPASAEQEAGEAKVQLKNPFELLPAIKFAVVFAVVVVVIKLARSSLGDRGVYLAAMLAGLTDVDAITLSMAQATLDGSSTAEVAVRSVVLATVSNTLVKTGIVLTGGGPGFRGRAGTALAVLGLGTGGLLAAWVFLGA
ncbi:MAG: MgtC/SapB family protein [Planctomycetes bacterium]|nr:MgtC/SapB family protein [Planctomycetota bacterium]